MRGCDWLESSARVSVAPVCSMPIRWCRFGRWRGSFAGRLSAPSGLAALRPGASGRWVDVMVLDRIAHVEGSLPAHVMQLESDATPCSHAAQWTVMPLACCRDGRSPRRGIQRSRTEHLVRRAIDPRRHSARRHTERRLYVRVLDTD